MPWADSVGEGKSKRAEKLAPRKEKNGEESRNPAVQGLIFLRVIFFPARLDFSSPTLSAHGSLRMIQCIFEESSPYMAMS